MLIQIHRQSLLELVSYARLLGDGELIKLIFLANAWCRVVMVVVVRCIHHMHYIWIYRRIFHSHVFRELNVVVCCFKSFANTFSTRPQINFSHGKPFFLLTRSIFISSDFLCSLSLSLSPSLADKISFFVFLVISFALACYSQNLWSCSHYPLSSPPLSIPNLFYSNRRCRCTSIVSTRTQRAVGEHT